MTYHFTPESLTQNYALYTPTDTEVWSILFNRQIKLAAQYASKEYLDGLKRIGLTPNKIPDYSEVNQALAQYTGWAIHVVPGLIANRPFFELMHNKQFCASTWLRRKDQLDYLEEPDMFHDIFGHIPMLSNKHICHFLQELARIALKYLDTPIESKAVEWISRLYWYTIEFGLIKEDNEIKIYGAGILSSSGESVYSIESKKPKRLPYDVQQILDTPYIKDHYQEQYFVIDSYKQLFNSIPKIEKALELKQSPAATRNAVPKNVTRNAVPSREM